MSKKKGNFMFVMIPYMAKNSTMDYGNNIHPCFQICALMADISGRNLQL